MLISIPSQRWQTTTHTLMKSNSNANLLFFSFFTKQPHKQEHNTAWAPWPCLEWLEWIGATREAQWNALVPPWQCIQLCALCLSTRPGLGNVWPMLEGENARLTSKSVGWFSVPRGLQHHRCQTPGPSFLLLELADQTLNTGLSKSILSRRGKKTD